MMTIEQPDYKRLLTIYMDYVGEQEGTDYMSYARPPWINKDDWAELRRVPQESSIEDSKPLGVS